MFFKTKILTVETIHSYKLLKHTMLWIAFKHRLELMSPKVQDIK